jgi:hypothetical protein
MESVKATLNNLLHPQNLSCDREWASTLEGSLEDLQSIAKISFLSIKTMKQAVPLSQRSLSSSSFGSTSILTTQTPPSSIITTPSGDLDTFHFDTSIDNGWHGTSYGPSLDPCGKMPAQLYEFQGIDINPSSNSSEITWGQNMSSPFPIYPYGNTIDKSEYPTSLTADTSHANSYGISTLPQPIPNLQVLGMSLDVPSDKGESHVSRPLTYTYGIDIINPTSNSSDITWGQNMFSPFPMYPYSSTIDRSECLTSLITDTPHANSYGISTSPQPIPNLQVLGMSRDVPSDKGESHVSRPLTYAYAYSNRETSGLDPFPDLQFTF